MKKMNNRVLAIILAVIVVLFILTKIYRASREKTRMQNMLFTVDKTQVTRIQIQPHADPGTTVTLDKTSAGWQVSKGTSRDRAQQSNVEELLGMLSQVESTRLVSRKKSDRKDYGVSDSSGTHVTVYHQSHPLADFWVGAGESQTRTAVSYLRVKGQDAIYQTTAGYLAGTLDKAYDQWRDPSVLRLQRSRISRVSFVYPRDTGFVLEKTGGVWQIGGVTVDSVKVASYLSKLAYQSLHHFRDSFRPPATPTLELSIGTDTTQLAVLDAWKTDTLWTLGSSTRPDTYFSSEGSGIVSSLFVGKGTFINP